jgi:hypothetical protein
LGGRISKTGNILNNSANLQIEEFQKQVQQNSLLYKKLIKNLIIDKFDTSNASDTSKEFFNKESVNLLLLMEQNTPHNFLIWSSFLLVHIHVQGILILTKMQMGIGK